MLSFTDLINDINEARTKKNQDLVDLIDVDIEDYLKKNKGSISYDIQNIIYLSQKYKLNTQESIQEIIDASNSSLKKLADKLQIPVDELTSLKNQLLKNKSQLKLLPQFQTKVEHEELMSGKITAFDLTIDLVTSAGQNAVVKQYTPLVNFLANKNMGKSSLSRAELISAGMLGLWEAVRNYDSSKSTMSFKSYAGYRINQAMMDDMNNYSHTLSTNWYGVKNGANVDAISIDNLIGKDDDDDYESDHMIELGVYDDHDSKDKQKVLAELYKMLEAKFSVRDCDIYYRVMGLKDYWGAAQRAREVAKIYKMSEGNVKNTIINKFNKFILSSPKAMSLMREIRESYEVTLLKELIYFDTKEDVYEALISNDMFILLEEMSRWSDKKSFKATIESTLNKLSIDDSKYFINCLNSGFEFIDETYKKNKKILIFILRELYPTETFNNKSDVYIIDKMTELSNISNEYKIKW
jgi:RNA polymerase sigma factor (sigma-70 family)